MHQLLNLCSRSKVFSARCSSIECLYIVQMNFGLPNVNTVGALSLYIVPDCHQNASVTEACLQLSKDHQTALLDFQWEKYI